MWMTATQAAEALGVPRTAMRAYHAKGLITTVRTPGGHRRYLSDDVMRIVRERKYVSPNVSVIPARAAR